MWCKAAPLLNEMKLSDKYVLITGASSGIGEALAYELSSKGMHCVLLARRQSELDRVSANIIERFGQTPITQVCDVTSVDDLLKAAKTVEAQLGRSADRSDNNSGSNSGIHLLILNAGMTMHGSFESSTTDALRRIMELNFFAAVETVRQFLPFLKRATGDKKIVLISTPSGLYGISNRFGYSASKAAAQAFIESIGHELKADNISTAIFYPGYVATSLRTSGIQSDGQPISEKQASNARSAEEVAKIFTRAIEKDSRHVFTNTTGRFVYYTRTLAPWLLDLMISKKHS